MNAIEIIESLNLQIERFARNNRKSPWIAVHVIDVMSIHNL